MKRLFWGIGLKEALKSEGAAQLEKTKISAKKKGMDVKWQAPSNYHATLLFLGETPEKDIDGIIEKGRAAARGFASFNLKLRGAGAFPKEEQGRVLYVGVQAKRDLLALHREFHNAFKKDFALDEREFIPHMTIGRLKNKRNLKDVVSPMKGKDFGKARVREVILYESSLSGAFPVYTPLCSLPLESALNSGQDGGQNNVENQNQDGVGQ